MSPRVSPAAPHERLPALRLLFPHVVDAPHVAAESAGLFVSRDGNGLVVGAGMVQAIPGALGIASPPRAESAEAADPLAGAMCDWLRARGVKVCQVFAPADDIPAMAALERRGFRRLTQLVSMHRAVDLESPHKGPLTFSPDAPPFAEPFRAVLLATYEDTRDCPELNGSRTRDELLASFLDPVPGGLNYLASRAGVPVGVVMLATGERSDAVELSYVGVAPQSRGRGFGRELVAFALAEAARARAVALTVAVDARNEPALRLYRRYGFTETDRREVWLAQFPD